MLDVPDVIYHGVYIYGVGKAKLPKWNEHVSTEQLQVGHLKLILCHLVCNVNNSNGFQP